MQLSHSIVDDELYSALCLLNGAIIYARLGDFSRASEHLQEVEEVEELLPITLCLMGHVEYELGNFEKAHDCFSIALEAMHESQSFDHLGMDYALREEQIQLNLDLLAKRSGSGMVGTIPADVLFEAPPRKDTSMPATSGDDDNWSIPSDSTSRTSSIESTVAPLMPTRPVNGREIEEDLGNGSTHTSLLHEPLASAPTAPVIVSSPAVPAPSPKGGLRAGFRKLKGKANRMAEKLSIKKPSAEKHSTKKHPIQVLAKTETPTPERRPTRPQARGARPAVQATVTPFIEQLPNQKALVARDARGRPGSIGDLADFFRGNDPIHDRPIVTPRLSAGSLPPMETDVSGMAGQRDSRPETTISSIVSTRENRVLKPRDDAGGKASPSPQQYQSDKFEGSNSEISMKPRAERMASAVSESSQQPRRRAEADAPKAERPRPLAIHPALRAGFTLDNQENWI